MAGPYRAGRGRERYGSPQVSAVSSGERSGGVRDRIARAAGGMPVAQFVRWAMSGAVVTAVNLGGTALLYGIAGLDIQVAIPISFTVGVALHFALQRYVVFQDVRAFALAMHHQVGRYVVIGVTQYAATAATTALLPELFGTPPLLAYFIAMVTFSVTSFFVLRGGVFHPAPLEDAEGEAGT
jgi:putative flippase GtrA